MRAPKPNPLMRLFAKANCDHDSNSINVANKQSGDIAATTFMLSGFTLYCSIYLYIYVLCLERMEEEVALVQRWLEIARSDEECCRVPPIILSTAKRTNVKIKNYLQLSYLILTVFSEKCQQFKLVLLESEKWSKFS